MTAARGHVRVTNDNVHEFYEYLFAPWVKALGLKDLKVSEGQASAVLPQDPQLHWANGAICGQAIMAAVDTVAALAMSTTDRAAKGTASQNTQFLKPAKGDDLLIDVNVLRFGGTIAYAEVYVSFLPSKELVAHSTIEFVF